MNFHAKVLKALGLPLLMLLLLLAASQATPARADAGAGSETVQAASVPAASAQQLSYFDMSPNYQAVKHLLREASQTYGIDYELLQAVIATESGFNSKAVSPKGAVGLMQLIPLTAERYGVRAEKDLLIQKKLTDPRVNIGAGSRYLRDLIDLFEGQLDLAVAAYNAGEGAVQRAGNKIPNYPETRNYVKNVMQLYHRLKLPAINGMSSMSGIASPGRVRMEFTGSHPSDLALGVSAQ